MDTEFLTSGFWHALQIWIPVLLAVVAARIAFNLMRR